MSADRGMEFEGKYDEDGNETPESCANRILAERLQNRWNELHRSAEEEGWRRQAIREGDDWNDEPEFDDEAESKAYYDAKKARERADSLEMRMIEDQLAELGGRMMRPYEHWNEEERMIEYLETRYDDCGG